MTSSSHSPFGLRARQIDLVDDRENFKIVIQPMNVGDGLRFNALGSVDD
jgi:hypothetical protein